MIWLTWRQHRTEAIILSIVLVLISLILLITGLRIIAFNQQVGDANCLNAPCIYARIAVLKYIHGNAFGSLLSPALLMVALLALPLCIGMFIGVQIIVHELEQGTYRLAWTQSIVWSRWLLIKLGVIIGYSLCAMAIISGLFLWWQTLIFPGYFLIHDSPTLWQAPVFDLGAPAIAYTLFALLLGICAGTLLRKTVPAMAVTLVLFVVIRFLITVFWRPAFLPPTIMTHSLLDHQEPPAYSWIMNTDELDRSGKILPHIFANGTNFSNVCDMQYNLLLIEDTAPAQQTLLTGEYQQCVATHGFQIRYVYQAEDHLWLFQAIEIGLYLLLSAILLAITFWWIKYRIIGEPQ